MAGDPGPGVLSLSFVVGAVHFAFRSEVDMEKLRGALRAELGCQLSLELLLFIYLFGFVQHV